MTNPREVSPASIEGMRDLDKKNSLEMQTFNDRRVLEFLHGKVVLSNFDDLFNLDMAIQLAGEGRTPSEQLITGKLSDAKTILGKYSSVDLMKETDSAVVSSTLENLKTPPANMPTQEAERVMNAWEYFNTIRTHCKRLLKAEDVLSNSRKAEYSATQSITEGVKDSLAGARKNWDTFSTGQKLAMAGVALIGGVMLFKSENKYVGYIKSALKTGVMVGGGAWLLNKAWFLFTGEGILDSATGTVSGGHKKSTFIKEAFRTDNKGAEIMTKSLVQMGDVSFMDLLSKYEQNKDKRTIEGTRMPPAEAYTAMEVLVNRFGIDALKRRHGKHNPPIKYSQVVVIEMAHDPDIKLKESIASRAYDSTGDAFQRGYHYLASTGPGVWLASKYESWFGEKATPEELQKFAKRFGEVVKDDKDVPDAIQNRLLPGNPQAAKNYVKTIDRGKSLPRYGLKYLVESDGYIYMIVDRVMNNVNGDEKAVSATIHSCIGQAEDFLVDQYGIDRETAARKSEPNGSVFVTSTATLKYCVRYKKK